MTEAGYKYLKTFQLATVIYDLTVEFCEKFLYGIDYRRMRDQMIQAARSGKQNIAEGYIEKSLKDYIRFLGFSNGSIKELTEDYEDFLRQRKLFLWDKNDPRVRGFRGLRVFGDFQSTPNSQNTPNTPIRIPDNPETVANLISTFCHQASYLLSLQIKSLEEKFLKEGGYTENLYKKRSAYRQQNHYEK